VASDPSRRRVLITGGSSGLGAAVAEALENRGDGPIVLDRRPPSDGTPHEIVDLADPTATIDAVQRVLTDHGDLDAVVTCAGMDHPAALGEGSFSSWQQIVGVNLLGTAAVLHAALPSLRKRQGHIVTVASTLGQRAVDHGTAYCASKFGVVGFTRSLMAELRGSVGVTLLTPGGMDTAFFDEREERFRPPPGTELLAPSIVADNILHALDLPTGCEIRELVIMGSSEGSWP